MLTLGYRVVEEGYAFWWPKYSMAPILYLPDGEEVEFAVKDYCPYL